MDSERVLLSLLQESLFLIVQLKEQKVSSLPISGLSIWDPKLLET